jgi:hypothetical protein
MYFLKNVGRFPTLLLEWPMWQLKGAYVDVAGVVAEENPDPAYKKIISAACLNFHF